MHLVVLGSEGQDVVPVVDAAVNELAYIFKVLFVLGVGKGQSQAEVDLLGRFEGMIDDHTEFIPVLRIL